MSVWPPSNEPADDCDRDWAWLPSANLLQCRECDGVKEPGESD